MPRYYFHIRDGEHLETDPEGMDFPDLQRAHDDAVLAARELIAERVTSGQPITERQFEITDEQGAVLDTLPIRSVLLFA